MTEQEAIGQFQERLAIEEYRQQIPEYCEAMELAVKSLEEIQKYRAIGTPDVFRATVEKQKAKNPIRNDKCTCPSCGTHNEVIKKRRNTVYSDIVYCWHCGQALKIFRSDGE